MFPSLYVVCFGPVAVRVYRAFFGGGVSPSSMRREVEMSTTQIILVAVLAVMVLLYLSRRRGRMKREGSSIDAIVCAPGAGGIPTAGRSHMRPCSCSLARSPDAPPPARLYRARRQATRLGSRERHSRAAGRAGARRRVCRHSRNAGRPSGRGARSRGDRAHPGTSPTRCRGIRSPRRARPRVQAPQTRHRRGSARRRRVRRPGPHLAALGLRAARVA